MNKKLLFFLFSFFFFLFTEAQCAMCRAVLESGEDQSMAQGVNNGIMYLMVIPYILVAVLGVVVYKAFSKKKEA